MTPSIRPMIDQAWAQRPDLPQTNTYQSCFELLQLILALAGPEWAHIGKTGGESGYAPAGFVPRTVRVRRSDGQYETLTITHLSHDAAWHTPSGRQIKVIVNSAANSDDRESIHGPARKGGDEIPVEFYRANNPPIPQLGDIVPVPMTPPVIVTPAPAIKPRARFYEELQAVNAYYAASDGLDRPGGMVKFDDQGRTIADVEALGAWGYNLMLGATVDECKARIRESGEWKDKHR